MIIFEVVGKVAVITLNRPDARNAINPELEQALYDALEKIEHDSNCHAGVIAANGPVYCAGADLKHVNSSEGASNKDEPLQRPTIVSRTHVKPLIAAVDGPAYGGGLEIILSCDMVVASNTAKFALSEVRWGLLPSGGGAFRLPQRLPRNVANQMLFTGGTIQAKRAYELGLVNELVEPGQVRSKALEMAELVAANGPLAIALTREVMEKSSLLNEDQCWKLSRGAVARNFKSNDANEGPRAFAEKRKPNWTGA